MRARTVHYRRFSEIIRLRRESYNNIPLLLYETGTLKKSFKKKKKTILVGNMNNLSNGPFV